MSESSRRARCSLDKLLLLLVTCFRTCSCSAGQSLWSASMPPASASMPPLAPHRLHTRGQSCGEGCVKFRLRWGSVFGDYYPVAARSMLPAAPRSLNI